jgi:hypothetical protein
MAALLPILLNALPAIINLIAQNHGSIQDFLSKLPLPLASAPAAPTDTLSQLLQNLLGGVTGGGTVTAGKADPQVVDLLTRIAVALEKMEPKSLAQPPTP